MREKVPHFIFSSTAAVYGTAGVELVREDARTVPESLVRHFKADTDRILRDTAAAYEGSTTRCLRHFNVAGADPKGVRGQPTPGATLLIKVAAEIALATPLHADLRR